MSRVYRETWLVVEVMEPLCYKIMDIVNPYRNYPSILNEDRRVENLVMHAKQLWYLPCTTQQMDSNGAKRKLEIATNI